MSIFWGDTSVTLRYVGKLPSANDLIQFNRVNRFHGASLKKRYTEELADSFRSQTRRKFFGHVTCTVNFYESSMRRDDDNVISACKYILDGLVHAGIIVDDSPKYCHVKPERWQSKLIIDGKKQNYVEVKIEESKLEDYL